MHRKQVTERDPPSAVNAPKMRGHGSWAITLRTYPHITSLMQRDAAQQLTHYLPLDKTNAPAPELPMHGRSRIDNVWQYRGGEKCSTIWQQEACDCVPLIGAADTASAEV
ncbi:MAG: hypothetical protein NVS2B16_38050 [Chloroflexota bacterium]